MQKITLQAPAKINLSLDVTGTRADGYHTIASVFQAVSLYDTITITRIDDTEITLSCNQKHIPCNQKNIAYKAAVLFLSETSQTGGFHIHIEKRIPSQAGLGGGSADGAAVLFGLNLLLETNVPTQRLQQLGAMLGADVPFFLLGGTAYAEGIGDQLRALLPIPRMPLVIAKGAAGISTPEAYHRIDALTQPRHPNTAAILQAIHAGKINLVCKACSNLFEQVTELPDVARIQACMRSEKAKCAVMSGSGSAVFGMFPTFQAAKKCRTALLQADYFAVVCETRTDGIQIVPPNP